MNNKAFNIICMSNKQIASFYAPYINIHYPNFLKDATSAIFSELYKRYVNILKKTPTERYIELLNDHPQLFDIVPLQEIASYLLITPVYLSRIRKSIQNKKSKKLS